MVVFYLSSVCVPVFVLLSTFSSPVNYLIFVQTATAAMVVLCSALNFVGLYKQTF